MKKVFSIAFLMMFILTSAQFRTKNKQQNRLSSDQQDFSYGYYIGVNLFDYKLHPNDVGLTSFQKFTIKSEPKMGFHAGLIAKWKLSDYFDFKTEPGIYFTQRDLIFNHVKSHISNTFGDYTIQASDTLRTIKSTYLDIPVFIHLHGGRWHNTRAYMQAGVGWAVNLQSNEKKLDDNEKGIFRTKTHNFNWQFEMGIDIYFSKFKLTPAVKGIFFFNNEWVPDNDDTAPLWAGSLTSLSTRAFIFSIKFE